MNKRFKVKLLSGMIASVLAMSAVHAQEASSSISGRVTDAAGNGVAGATVDIVDTRSRASTKVMTGADGRYAAQGLSAAGPFDIAASKPDGGKAERDNVFPGAVGNIAVDLALAALGDTTETADQKKSAQRVNPSSTSNTTTANDTLRAQEMATVRVNAQALSLGGGLMSVQSAAKAVSTITRDAIIQAAPGATYAQIIDSIPGVVAITDDVTGLNDANYSIRGFTNDEIGVTINGAPINDSGNYRVYPTEYGDTENIGDITVLQGYPDVDQPVAGAAGGTIAWATIDPSHTPGIDLSFSGGSHSYEREFIRLNTGDTGPVRSWLSYSHNEVDLWRGDGNSKVDKIDGKSIWTIDDDNSISASLQYNRELKYGYNTESKATAAADYFKNYDTTLL
ncbi:MAG: TonB-dependent receptor plug domain-containing protein, partial [Rudaea sp.]